MVLSGLTFKQTKSSGEKAKIIFEIIVNAKHLTTFIHLASLRRSESSKINENLIPCNLFLAIDFHSDALISQKVFLEGACG